jgi:glycosyltransferase involved in cell wall biosynthesis
MKSVTPRPRTVLVIAYAFPPEAYVGARRTLKYCKYLGEFGWRPIVLTIRPRASAFQDERLTHQLPEDLEVHRTRDVDGVEWVTKAAALWHRVRRRREAPSESNTSSTAGDQRQDTPRLVERCKALIDRLLLETPDSHLLWVPVAFMRGARILLTRRVDVVYSSSPPHSSHLTGYLLAKIFRKPHVTDFRDPWVINGCSNGVSRVDRLERWQLRARRAILTNAAKITVVSPREPQELRARVPELDYGRIAVVTNGYDPEDFPPGDAVAPDPARFTITHAGTIYRETGRAFFDALERVAEQDAPLCQTLRLNLVGDIDPSHAEAIGRLEAAGVVRMLGLQPHHVTLGLMRGSDVLLLLPRGGTSPASHLPAKVFEYLHIGKPIFAIGADGALRELLESSGLGMTADPDDVQGIAEAIQVLCRNVRRGHLRLLPNRAYIEQFDRRSLTERFARVLDEAAACHGQERV